MMSRSLTTISLALELVVGLAALGLVADQQVEQPAMPRLVRRIEEMEEREARVGEHGAQLAELEEPFVAVVLPHAARAGAAERQVVLRHVQHAVVDRDAA